MARILIAELKQETATFNPALSVYDDFRICRGDEILSAYRDTATELCGALDCFRDDGRIEVGSFVCWPNTYRKDGNLVGSDL